MSPVVCYEYGAGAALLIGIVWLIVEFFRKS